MGEKEGPEGSQNRSKEISNTGGKDEMEECASKVCAMTSVTMWTKSRPKLKYPRMLEQKRSGHAMPKA